MPNQTKYPPSQVIINPEVKKQAMELAKEKGWQFSWLIEKLLKEWIDENSF